MVFELLLAINQHHYVEAVDDQNVWKYEPSGTFSVDSFSLQDFKNTVDSLE